MSSKQQDPVELLREAWRRAKAVQKLIAQARGATADDVRIGVLGLAAENNQKCLEMINQAAVELNNRQGSERNRAARSDRE